MRLKPIIYTCVFGICFFLNAFYYRQYLIETWMQWQLRNEHIVISLSTTPHRINALQPTLASLFTQSAPLKAIYLNIPYRFKRDNLEYNVPYWLLNEPRITLLRGEDYGPGTKLLGTLKQAQLPAQAIIITVDDDVIYPQNLVLHLAYKAYKNPDRAIGLIGANPDPTADIGLMKIKVADSLASLLQGYAGVAYRRSFFDANIFDMLNAPPECINSDDIYISFYLAQHAIPRQVLRNRYINSCSIHWETEIGTNANALHNLIPTPAEKHQVCLAYLKTTYPDVVF